MRAFSPVVLVTLTVTRKFFSILFSIVRFGHAVREAPCAHNSLLLSRGRSLFTTDSPLQSAPLFLLLSGPRCLFMHQLRQRTFSSPPTGVPVAVFRHGDALHRAHRRGRAGPAEKGREEKDRLAPRRRAQKDQRSTEFVGR